MADVKQCDVCGQTEDDPGEWEFWWYTVGSIGGGHEEACSMDCAIKLVKKAAKRKAKLDREIAEAAEAQTA